MFRQQESNKIQCVLNSPFSEVTLNITGPSCTGKTMVLLDVVSKMDVVSVYIDETEYTMNADTNSNAPMLVLLLHKLYDAFNLTNDIPRDVQVSGVFNMFQTFAQQKKMVFIFDNPERYCSPSVIYCLNRIPLVTKSDIRIVFISSEQIKEATGRIWFEPYTKEQVRAIVMQTSACPPKLADYVSDAFPVATVDEFKYVLNHCMEYTKEATNERVDWETFSHLRVLVFDLQHHMVPRKFNDTKKYLDKRVEIPCPAVVVPCIPPACKLMLIASYIATNNPASYDDAIFGKQKRRSKLKQEEEDKEDNIVFPLSRVQSMYTHFAKSYLDDHYPWDARKCLSRLCLRGLVQTRGTDRFVCVASEEEVKCCCEYFGIILNGYLFKTRSII